jgi:hypothetical protein
MSGDWRIGFAVTPVLREHPWWGVVGIVRRIMPESPSSKEFIEVEIYRTDGDHIFLQEPSDEWRTA